MAELEPIEVAPDSGNPEAKTVDVETAQFLTDVETAAGLLFHGKRDKGLAQRISDGQARLRKKLYES